MFCKILIPFFFFVRVKSFTPHNPCPGAVGQVQVQFIQCDGFPCLVKRGLNHTIEMKFTAPFNIVEAKQYVSVAFLGRQHISPLDDNKPACPKIYSEDGSTFVGCPLKKGTPYTYRYVFFVPSATPKVNAALPLHWALKDATTKKEIACFEINFKVT